MFQPAADSILMPLTFPIASLNRYTPNFSGVPQKLTWCQQFGLQIFPKWGDAHICPQKNAVFRCFFGQNKFSWSNGLLSPFAMSYIFGKLWHSAIIWPIRKSFQSILQGVRFLLANHTLLSGTSENESYVASVCWSFQLCEAGIQKHQLLLGFLLKATPFLLTYFPYIVIWVARSCEKNFRRQ